MATSGYFTGYVWRPDRRRHPRVLMDSNLSVERLDGHDRLGHIMDLSLGGVRFRSVGPRLTREEVLRVAFNLGTDTFTLFGKTIRITRLDAFAQEATMAFAGMEPERRERLRRKLYPYAPDSY